MHSADHRLREALKLGPRFYVMSIEYIILPNIAINGTKGS